jgi:hypothetical protein
MELVDRVQVAAGRAVEKERHQLRQQNRATEKELSVAQTTLRRYKKATEKVRMGDKAEQLVIVILYNSDPPTSCPAVEGKRSL